MAAKRNVLTAALICATAAAVLTGCGAGKDTAAGDQPTTSAPSSAATTTARPAAPFDGLTAKQISDKAVAAMKSLSSVTVDFDGTDSGTKIRMKAAMTNDDKCVSHIVMGGGNLQLIGVGKDTYAKGDNAFWNAQAGADGAGINQLLNGRWLKMPAGSAQEDDFKSFCELNAFMAGFTENSGSTTKGAPTMVDGQSTVPVSGPDDGGTTTVYVAAQGEPYVLKAVHTGSDPGTATFTDFNKPVNAVAPPASQTVDASALGS